MPKYMIQASYVEVLYTNTGTNPEDLLSKIKPVGSYIYKGFGSEDLSYLKPKYKNQRKGSILKVIQEIQATHDIQSRSNREENEKQENDSMVQLPQNDSSKGKHCEHLYNKIKQLDKGSINYCNVFESFFKQWKSICREHECKYPVDVAIN